MKAIISTTYDDKYFFFLPIVVWCWNKLGVKVLCFSPVPASKSDTKKQQIVGNAFSKLNLSGNEWVNFSAPSHKEATYAQCSRLFAGLPNDNEILIISDADMITFAIPPYDHNHFTVFGSDLVPEKQYPMCYVSAESNLWNKFFSKGRSPQICLDNILGDIECESFAGNYWSKDQEELFNGIASYAPVSTYPRAKPGTQFASNRLDRDDSFLLDRLSPEIFDYHMPRMGFELNNFNQILNVLRYFYPNEDFQWLIDYRNEYIKLL